VVVVAMVVAVVVTTSRRPAEHAVSFGRRGAANSVIVVATPTRTVVLTGSKIAIREVGWTRQRNEALMW
jgi:hypothetical protein